jgi:hypothetical protein
MCDTGVSGMIMMMMMIMIMTNLCETGVSGMAVQEDQPNFADEHSSNWTDFLANLAQVSDCCCCCCCCYYYYYYYFY